MDLEGVTILNPNHIHRWWVADFPSTAYNDSASVAAIARYDTCWGAWDYPYLGELQAEILFKIDNAYAASSLSNPFIDVAMIVFIYHGNAIEMPGLYQVGGYGYNSVRRDKFPFLSVMRDDFFEASPIVVPGFQQEDLNQSLWGLRWIVVHEAGHHLGFPHTSTGICFFVNYCTDPPTTGSNQYRLNPESYFYGPYSNMRLVQPAAMGPTPYHETDLLKRGWLDIVEIDSDTLGIELADVRLGKTVLRIVTPGTQFSHPNFPHLEHQQAFTLSYHGGNGMDAFKRMDGNPIYPSKGLAIWNSLLMGRALPTTTWLDSNTWDLESAWGRYEDPDTVAVGLDAWEDEDANGGFDNLDVWVDFSVQNDCATDFAPLYAYFYDYPGSTKDFFGAMSGKLEFSYRTNPNTNGSDTWLVGRNIRRQPQDIPNSMIIRIVEELSDRVVLDILFAPREAIVFPNGGEILQTGEPYAITWSREYTTDQPEGIINTVDIYCSRGEGYDDQLIVSGVDATLGSYQWTPAAAHLGKTCKIRTVYHNVNDAGHVGEDESDAVFTVVDLPTAKFTDVSSQAGLVPSGVPYSAAPGDFQADEKNDLLITATGSGVSMGRVTLVQPSGTPLFSNVTVSNVANGRGVVVADFDNDGDQDFFMAHETDPRLYRNQNGTFFDVSGPLANLAAPSTAACWGDYDRDGWLDLYVVGSSRDHTEPPDYLNIAGQSHRLFRNLGATGGGFADVTVAAGIGSLAGNGSVSASWGDIENDGDLDLIVTNLQEPPTGPGGIGNHLFVNQGDGTFIEEFLDRFPGEFFYCTAAQWADMNNDGFLDLAVSCAQAGSAIYFNDGSGHFPAADRVWFDASGNGYNGVQVFDQDLDGWNDVLWISRSTSEPSQFFSGVPTATGVGFVNNTAHVGLAASSKAMGAVAADYTHDGDLDLFVGRPASSGEYFYKTDSRSGANSLGRNYVKVRLDSPLKANNRQGIGAAVTVTAGDLVQTRVVDGGSGRGGQQARDLIFGLGDYSGTVTATVKWPRGHVQSDIPMFVSGPATADSTNTVVDETMVISNLNATSIVVPGTTLFDWVFSWDTNEACDSSLDVLTFDQAGIQNPCWPGWTTLTPSSPGVVYTYEPKPGGGYLHRFTVYGQECNLNCSFSYWAFSAMGANKATSVTKTKQVKFCPSGF